MDPVSVEHKNKEYFIDGNTVIVDVRKVNGDKIKISFRPLTNEYLNTHKEMFVTMGVTNLETLYDRDVLQKLVRQYGTNVIPLDSEPPLDYVSPEKLDNGKVETKSLEFIADTFGISTQEYMRAYSFAQKVYAKEILKI